MRLDDSWATPLVRKFIYSGRFEEPEYRVLVKTLRSDDRYLEIGAGLGFLTTIACQRVGSKNVFAYEANPQLVPVIEATANANGCRPIVVNAVLGETEDTVDFFVDDNFLTSSLHDGPGTRRIKVPKHSFQAELEKVKPTYLMIDVEGGEVELLGERTLPDHVRAICVETHSGQRGAKAIQEILNTLAGDGFVLDLAVSRDSVAFLSR